MSILSIKFEYMFMLVKRKHDNVVLLPTGYTNTTAKQPEFPHDLTVTYWDDGGSHTVPIAGQDVSFWYEAEIAKWDDANSKWQQLIRATADSSTKGPDNDYIMHFQRMTSDDGPARIRAELFAAAPVPADLNGRVFLPHGHFVHAQPVKAEYANTKWLVQGQTPSARVLTDVVQFVAVRKGNPRLGIKIGDGPVMPISSNKTVTFINDEGKSNKAQSETSLDDFAVMYALARESSDWVVPKILWDDVTVRAKPDKPKMHADERPICGGGQGCEEDGVCPPLEP